MRKVAVISLLIISTMSTFAGTKGSLSVIVKDASGVPLPGAIVLMEGSGTTRQAVTDDKGEGTLRQLPPASDYVITVTMQGFGTVKQEGVKVSVDANFELTFSLQPDLQEVLTIVAERPSVDQTTQVSGDYLELGLIESLPTARNYQDYLQLVTGVLPTNTGNPAVKSGLNYSDIRGTQGNSTDNFIYIDGINTTDNVSGTFGANFNSEIIAEQEVMTGGMPAEYEGSPGLISNVVTKTGTNQFEGSVNYYFQNSGLVGSTDDGVPEQSEYSTYDTAFVLSGPIVKDKLFFLGSWQIKNTTQDITEIETGGFLRTSENKADYQYLKLSYNPTYLDSFDFVYSADPTDIIGSTNPQTINARDSNREQGGDRISLNYSRIMGDSSVLEVKAGWINSKLAGTASDSDAGPQNQISFSDDQEYTIFEQQLGGYDYNWEDKRNKTVYELKYTISLNTENLGTHEIKLGAGYAENENILTDSYPSGAHWNSASIGAGVHTMADIANLGIFGDTDYDRLAQAINTNYTHLIGQLDLNGDGMIDRSEINAAAAGFTDGNPHGQVNAYRIYENNAGVNNLKSEGLHYFIQDNISAGKWNFNLGLRLEEFEHFSATGVSIHKFDMEMAPRIGINYDVMGDGRHKAWVFYGRYYDPIRGNMTDFAGAWTGWERFEQAYIAGEWVTMRVRGGSETIDALFAPTTKTPYTDDLMVGYKVDLGSRMSLEFNFTDRMTKNILEDYDISPYSFVTEGQGYYTDPNIVGEYALPLSYFGYTYEELLSNPSNYVIATMKGGKRTYTGYDVTFRKAMSNNWQLLASYTLGDSKGNTNSDSNADLQGDFEQLDPRVPGMYARQPGSIQHLFKVAGSYQLPLGFQVGGSYRWNSGLYYTKSTYFYSRYLPLGWDDVDVFDPNSGIADGIIGAEKTPAFGILDLRVNYTMNFLKQYKLELFVDIFNALDDQAVTSEEGLIDGSLDFGEAKSWERPRRIYLGARMSF